MSLEAITEDGSDVNIDSMVRNMIRSVSEVTLIWFGDLPACKYSIADTMIAILI